MMTREEMWMDLIHPLVQKFACAEKKIYHQAILLAQSIVSSNEKMDSYERYCDHQQVSDNFASAREEAGVAEKVFGFFEFGVGTEESLFGRYPERVSEIFLPDRDCSIEDLIIGFGPEDFVQRIRVCKETDRPFIKEGKEVLTLNEDRDFGWKDGYGEHVEFYNAEAHVYVRKSMSGRTYYTLEIDPDTGIAIPVTR